MSLAVIPPVALVGRGFNLYGQVVEASDGGAEAGKDLSSANITVRFRAYEVGTDSSYLKNVTLTKTAGTTGYFTGYIPAFTTAYARVLGEVVMVDAGTADAGTPTGYKEVLLERGFFQVVDTAT